MSVRKTEATNRFRLMLRTFRKEKRMMGAIYRTGLRIKNFGEKHHIAFLARLGIQIMDKAISMGVGK